MRKSGFFPRLALVNLLRNGRYYGPYLLSCGGVAAMYYILRFLSGHETLKTVRGAMYLQSLSDVGCFVVALFAAVILLYANSFVMKRRQKELGLYNILGLEKRHIALVMCWETALCTAAVISGGIAAGILLSKLMLLVVLKMSRLPVLFGFSVSLPGIAETAVLFAVLMVLTLFQNLFRLYRSRPVELLHSESAGEREPRTRWLLALIGLAALLGGYGLSFTMKSSIVAMAFFFPAVALVMLGTYCLFTAGSIALLKRLRANRNFYYQTNHFTAVSGLLYRMKQNAVGLANICILSTMVLVTVSTTICLYVGLDRALEQMFPYDIEFLQDLDRQSGDSMAYLEEVRREAASVGEIQDLQYYNRYWVYCGWRSGVLSLNMSPGTQRTLLEIVAAEDYARLTGQAVSLAPGETLVHAVGLENFPMDFRIARFNDEHPASYIESPSDLEGYSFHVQGRVTAPIRHATTNLLGGEEAELFLVVADRETAENLMAMDRDRTGRQFRIQMNLPGEDYGEKLAQTEDLVHRLSLREGGISFVSKQDQAVEYYAMYGGFLFLGVFLGLLFLMTTVLIIYYKQISEGYEDQRRYHICRQVGMTEKEVKASIHSQILLVFFLPLGTAGVHVLAAFPMLSRMLELFNLHDVRLFALCTAGTMLAFCVIYALVYGLTASAYDRIVGGEARR